MDTVQNDDRIVETTLGPKPESELIRTTVQVETIDQGVTSTEYCLAGCQGPAHVTGVADAPGVHCRAHIHRSVRVHVKRFPEGAMAGALQSFA